MRKKWKKKKKKKKKQFQDPEKPHAYLQAM